MGRNRVAAAAGIETGSRPRSTLIRNDTMARSRTCVLLAFVLGGITIGGGCGTGAPPAQPSAGAAPQSAVADETAEAFAKMDPADRDVARRQAVCPVSDHALGSMGPPVKVTHDGQTLFLCCDGCKDDFDKDPQVFVAKLKK
jgi:YHS domain-containing protein